MENRENKTGIRFFNMECRRRVKKLFTRIFRSIDPKS